MESGVRWPDLTNVFTCLSLMYTTYQRRSPHFLCYVAPIPGSPGNARLSQVISGQSYWLGGCVCVCLNQGLIAESRVVLNSVQFTFVCGSTLPHTRRL